MRFLGCVLVLLTVLTGSAAAQEVMPGDFGTAFNRAAKRIGADITLSKVDCDSGKCEYGAVPDLRVLVTGDSANEPVSSVAAYLPRDAADKARSRRSAVAATLVAATLIAVFSPAVSAKSRGGMVKALLDGATGRSARGEVALGGFNYVLSATQADNLRLYVEK